MRLEQIADPERRVAAKARHHLAGQLRVRQRLGGLVLEPLHDRNAAVAEDHHRVVRVTDDARELALENLVELFDDFLLVESHEYSWFAGRVRSVARPRSRGNAGTRPA